MDKIIPKYTSIIVLDGKTNGIKRFLIQGGGNNNNPTYVSFQTTGGDAFCLTPTDAKLVIDAVNDGNPIYIKHTGATLDKVLHYINVIRGLREHEED